MNAAEPPFWRFSSVGTRFQILWSPLVTYCPCCRSVDHQPGWTVYPHYSSRHSAASRYPSIAKQAWLYLDWFLQRGMLPRSWLSVLVRSFSHHYFYSSGLSSLLSSKCWCPSRSRDQYNSIDEAVQYLSRNRQQGVRKDTKSWIVRETNKQILI